MQAWVGWGVGGADRDCRGVTKNRQGRASLPDTLTPTSTPHRSQIPNAHTSAAPAPRPLLAALQEVLPLFAYNWEALRNKRKFGPLGTKKFAQGDSSQV